MYDAVVIGGGVAGYPAAVTLARRGFRVAVVEEGLVGGECTNYGCVPSKALLHYSWVVREARRLGLKVGGVSFASAFSFASRVAGEEREGLEALLERAGVEVVKGRGAVGSCKDGYCKVGVDGRVLDARWVLVATGSEPVVPPWVDTSCESILDNRGLFTRGLPDGASRVAVLGGGVGGFEVGVALSSLGVNVVLYEAMPRLLPSFPESISRFALRVARLYGVDVRLSSRVSRAKCKGGAIEVCVGSSCESFDAVIVMLGRRPRLEALGALGDAGPEKRGLCYENIPVCIAGDAAGPPFLAHKAIAEGLYFASRVAGLEWRLPRLYPQVVYTEPEMFDATLPGVRVQRLYRYYWGFAAPARIRGIPAQVVYGEVGVDENERIVAVRLVGPSVSELAGEAVLIIEKGLGLRDIIGVPHAHPSSSEVIMEIVLEALGLGYHRI